MTSDSSASSLDLSKPLDQLGAGRLADFRGNVIRMLGRWLYIIHLLNYASNAESARIPLLSSLAGFLQLKSGESISPRVHLAFSLIAIMWIGWAVLVQRSLFERRIPSWLPFDRQHRHQLMTAAAVVRWCPKIRLVCAHLLIIMLVAMRLQLGLVWCTCGSLLGLLTILAATRWPSGILEANPLPAIPRHYQLMLGLAIVLAGVIAAQWVRITRRMMVALTETASGKETHG